MLRNERVIDVASGMPVTRTDHKIMVSDVRVDGRMIIASCNKENKRVSSLKMAAAAA